ncbi:MAG: type II restriction endonuclease [Bacteroides sp.]|nr:type II restriction endonuclease [Bacteroides sp.]MCM1379173.1 type II restriction endonuclease [Bacteroides sp.]MCM1445178.1 type II restriction endonuclease [Prevotella sp.]
MNTEFPEFLRPLRETNFTLADFVDFKKVSNNVDAIAIKLNLLNFLLNKEDLDSAVKTLWNVNPSTFSVLGILIAVRPGDNKKALTHQGETSKLNDWFTSPDKVIEFLNETGLSALFKSGKIKNLVDYVFGVEVGLDSNARKNRGGHLMENIVAGVLRSNNIKFKQEVYCSEFPQIKAALGVDNKRFDFAVYTPEKTFLIETNFYSASGSKLNEVARAYSELAPKINAINGFEFIWITDGIGWKSAANKLQEAFEIIPGIYNLSTLQLFIDRLK